MLRFAGRIAIFCVAVVAEVAESADAMDSKSISRKGVGVQVPPPAPVQVRLLRANFSME